MQKIAKSELKRIRQEYQEGNCAKLATYHYHGEYSAYRDTLTRLVERGLAGEECKRIMEFRYRAIARDEVEEARVRDALQETAETLSRLADEKGQTHDYRIYTYE